MNFNIIVTLFLIVSLYNTVNCLIGMPVEKYVFDSTIFKTELNWNKQAFGDSNEIPGVSQNKIFFPFYYLLISVFKSGKK
jgi:hypothetical protein